MILGSDKPTKGKAFYIVLMMILVSFLIFAASNTSHWNVSVMYSILAVGTLAFVAFDWVLKEKDFDILDTVTYEPKELRPFGLGKVSNYVLLILAAVIIISLVFQISSTRYSVVASPFQTLPFESAGWFIALMSGIIGLAENLFFFGMLFPTLLAVVCYIFRPPKWVYWIILPLIILLMGGIFTMYHFSVYGMEMLLASESAFMFAIINCILVFSFRSLFLSDIMHFTNNFVATMVQTGTRVGIVVVGGG